MLATDLLTSFASGCYALPHCRKMSVLSGLTLGGLSPCRPLSLPLTSEKHMLHILCNVHVYIYASRFKERSCKQHWCSPRNRLIDHHVGTYRRARKPQTCTYIIPYMCVCIQRGRGILHRLHYSDLFHKDRDLLEFDLKLATGWCCYAYIHT